MRGLRVGCMIDHSNYFSIRVRPTFMSDNQPIDNQRCSMYITELRERHPQLNLTSKTHECLFELFSLSDFVATTTIKYPQLIEFIETQPSAKSHTPDYDIKLVEILHKATSETELNASLRQFRHQEMAKIAILDLLNYQEIERSLEQVSSLADALILNAYNWLYANLTSRYGIPEGPSGPMPLLILGMGKLGGSELNFSSDIDLIFCYPESGEITTNRKPVEHHQFFTKLAQKLIGALNQTTIDGQVFRVDMRLRPFGESGPLSIHFAALEDYYQHQGREWERYAMVKARILNPDCPYTAELYDILRPFVFRRYLDYGAIDSLRSMKRLISQDVRRRGLKNNIKLGKGGIREVEFIVQSFQLIKGGRETDLQTTGLMETLDKLVEYELLPEQDASQLRFAYLFLRKVEHCLQQFDDKQTQVLTGDSQESARLCHVMGFEQYQDFQTELAQQMQFVHHQFQLLVGEEPSSTKSSTQILAAEFEHLWQMKLTIKDMQELLPCWKSLPLDETFYVQLFEFKSHLLRYGVTQKGQDMLALLVPSLLHNVLETCSGETDSDFAQRTSELLARLLTIFKKILGRTTYLQLLGENLGAQGQLVKLCHASPWIAELIGRYPILLDELLNPQQLYQVTPFDEYAAELRQILLRIEPDDLELQMETLRQFKQIHQLKIAAADVTNILPVMQVSDHLTVLAEAIINEVVNLAWSQMTQKFGLPALVSEEQKGFAIIGYGKLGGIELGYGSDLDLVFLHNCDSNEPTNGDKNIDSLHFYTKLAQRIMHLFMTKTPSGQLYEVDMRLRPSGNSGLLVSHVNGFETYQTSDAWTWEHQALVRARVVVADSAINQRFVQIRKQVLCLPRDNQKLIFDVTEMRIKMRDHLVQGSESQFDIKQDVGGIADIEFLVQYWVLANSAEYSQLTKWQDNVRILEDLCNLEIISIAWQEKLTHAYLQYRNTSHRLTLLQKKVLSDKDEFFAQRESVTEIWHTVFTQ